MQAKILPNIYAIRQRNQVNFQYSDNRRIYTKEVLCYTSQKVRFKKNSECNVNLYRQRAKSCQEGDPESPVIPAMRAALCLCSRWLPLSSDYSHYGRTRVTRPPFSLFPPLREGDDKVREGGSPEIVRKQSCKVRCVAGAATVG